MGVPDGKAWLFASQEIPRFVKAQPRETSKEAKHVRKVGINEFSCQYKSGDCKKQGQKLGRWIFDEHLMVNGAKRYPHLTIGHLVFTLRCSKSEEDDLVCPAGIEVRKQVVNTPLMVAVNSAPWWC